MQVSMRPEFNPQNPDVGDPLFEGEVEPSHDDPRVLSPDVLVEFANCRTDVAGVRRFVERFGPLNGPTTFPFSLAVWIADQKRFQDYWKFILKVGPWAGMPAHFPPSVVPPIQRVQATGSFEITPAGLVYSADSLYEAMLLKLLHLYEKKKLRHCENPACAQTPFFVAEHARQRYCSTVCSEWGQSEAKKKWWDKKGPSWRLTHSGRADKKRKSARGVKHGAK
jgi:hypothetical protein